MDQQNRNAINQALETVAYYTVGASVTGAIPVPAASVAVVAENTAMVTHISSIYGQRVSINQIMQYFGVLGTINIFGRQLFIEGARLLSWGSGQWWAQGVLSVLGSTTAGVQTYIIGRLSIAIAENDGLSLTLEEASRIIKDAEAGYARFLETWKRKIPRKPK